MNEDDKQATLDEEAERELFLRAVEQTAPREEARRGEMLTGEIVALSGEFAVVDLGGKSEGFLSLEELRDQDNAPPQVGDQVEACVVSSGADGVILSRRLAQGIRDRQFLAEAARSRIPVEGRVVGRNKGGFDVELAGLRAFCPIGQIDRRYCDDPDAHLNQRYNFIITKYDDGGRRPDVVLSRREFLQIEAARRAEELRQTLGEGEILSGRVKSVHDFGAFVDLGGLDGLLPASEISYDRRAHPGDLLTVGEQVNVQVVSFDSDSDKITLSLKRLEADPWQDVMLNYPEGSRHQGEVVKIKPFGAFVQLEPGVEGLLHVSNLNTPERVNSPTQVLQEGQEVTVEVLSLEPEVRRIGLARVPRPGEFGDVPLVGAVLEGQVDSVANFGVFVVLGPGRKGLIPNSEMGTPRGTDHRQQFPAGTRVRVKVLEVTDNGRRIRLSRRAVIEEQERGEVDEYLQSKGGSEDVSFGTLGDIIKKKLPKT